MCTFEGVVLNILTISLERCMRYLPDIVEQITHYVQEKCSNDDTGMKVAIHICIGSFF